MEANKDEAAKCFKMAKTALSRQDYPKALKLATKAYSMFPCQEYKTLMEKCTVKMAQNNPEPEPDDTGESRPDTTRSSNADTQNRRDTNNRSATAEQERLCRKIVNAKDYYEVLDVQRTDSEDTIKRNYKKLHPDKNPSPLASEAFKKVSTAFQCLTNPRAKEEYDMYGEEGRTHQHHFHEEFVTPDQLFEAFFGVSQRNNLFHFATAHGPRRRQQNEPQITSFRQLIPFIIVVFILMIPNLLSKGDVYKLERTSKYSKRMATKLHGVTFYVDPKNFEREYPERSQERIQVEYEVDHKHFQRSCDRKKSENQKLIYSYVSALRKPPAELYETPQSCKILQNLREEYTKLLHSYNL